MSDIPATAAATATILCAWLSRRHRGFAPLAGALLALGVLIRPTNALLLAPVALCLGLDLRRWLLLGLGGLPGAAALLTYNTSAYGHPLVSGYGGIGSSFSTGFVPVTLEHYARWLPILLTPAGLLSLALPWFGRRERIAWVLVAWIVPLFAFYLAYRHTHEWWWYLRFLLPAFPACLIGGLWVGHRLWTLLPAPSLKLPHRARGLAVAASLAALGQGIYWDHRLDAHAIGDGERVYAETVDWARKNLPAGAVLLAMQTTGALVYYSDFAFVRWDQLDAASFARVTAAMRARGTPLYAVLFPFEVRDALEERARGNWTEVGAVRQVTIWRWAPTAP
jgi:hypothetical protein